MSTMGERIKRAREDKGFFQQDLANMIGVKSAAVISNWEKDANKPDADKIVRLCKALDISASYLLDYYGENSTALSNNELDHIKKYRSLNKSGREKVDGYMDDLLDSPKYCIPGNLPMPDLEKIKEQFGPQIEAFRKNQKSLAKK